MKDVKDPGTVEIAELPIPSRRGRRPTGNAKTGAQRQAEWRAKRDAEDKALRSVQSESDEVKVLRDRIAELEQLVQGFREICYRKENENRDLARVIQCLKTGERPRDLASRGLFSGITAKNVTVTGMEDA